MSTVVAVAFAVLVAAVAGLLGCVAMWLRRIDRDIQRLNARYAPAPPVPTIRIPAVTPLPPMRRSWTSER